MNSIKLIRALSETGANDLSAALAWVNPIPAQGLLLSQKITEALQIVGFAQNRQGKPGKTQVADDNIQLLTRLKSEIDSILNQTES
jgi:hypothetical protein